MYDIIIVATTIWRSSRPGFLSFDTHFTHTKKKKNDRQEYFANTKNQNFANSTINTKHFICYHGFTITRVLTTLVVPLNSIL